MKTPGEWTLVGFFADRPRSRELFEHIRSFIGSLGPMKIEVMRTQISFGTKRKFACIWLPQKWIKKREEGSITLTFALLRRIDDLRIEEAVEPRPGRWTHHIIIRKGTDLDENVMAGTRWSDRV
jgi:hypothetical protein